MKDKKVLIRVGILALVILIVILNIPNDDSQVHGNNYTVQTTKVDLVGKETIKNVFLLMDASGSMKGYLDFSGYPEAQKTLVSTITMPLDRLSSDYGSGLQVKYGASGKYAHTTVTDLQNKMVTGQAFNGQDTRLDLMIADAVKQASDSTISMLVSDMVLSYGPSELRKTNNPWLNKHNLNDLGAKIHTALSGADDVKVLLLQYYSDFNGKYYYNCTENIQKGTQFKNILMKERPYYIMLFGKKNLLKSVLDNGVFVPFQNVYASFDLDENDLVTNPLRVKFHDQSSWISDNSSEDPDNEKVGTIWTKADLGNVVEVFEVQFDRFKIPAFLNQNYEIGDYHLSNTIKNITEITDSNNRNLLRFNISLKPFSDLPSSGKVSFSLVCSNSWAQDASVVNHDDVNVENASELEKKTWGLSAIINNIDAAYFGNNERNPQEVAKISFNLEKF